MSTRPGLVLVHGWGLGRTVWDLLAAKLTALFDLTVLDLPGYHDTPALSNANLELQLDWLATRIPADSHVLGWSLGGSLLCELLLRKALPVSSLVTFASNPCFVAHAGWPGMAPASFQAFCRQQGEDAEAGLLQFASLVALGGPAERQTLRAARAIARNQPTVAASSRAVGLQCLAQIDYRARLAALPTPCLHIYAEHDQLVPVTVAAEVPGSRVIPGNHAALLGCDVTLSTALLDFYGGLGVSP